MKLRLAKASKLSWSWGLAWLSLAIFRDLIQHPAPLANFERSIEIHNQIIDDILANKNHQKCDIQILTDFNINMLNFQSHGLTNDYINSLISNSLILTNNCLTNKNKTSVSNIN